MKRFKELLDFVGLSYKKEILKIAIINVVLLSIIPVSYFLLKQPTIMMLGIAIMVIINYLIFSGYTSKKRKVLMNRENEFIVMIGYYQIFISNSYNVYQALQSLLPYASPWMEEQLQCLLTEIDNDKTVKPFINFAEKFTNKVSSNVMLSIYQMIDEGESGIHMMQL